MTIKVSLQTLQSWAQEHYNDKPIFRAYILRVFGKYDFEACHFQTQEHLRQAFRGLYTTKPDMFWDFELLNHGISATVEPRYAARSTTDKFLKKYVHARMNHESWSQDENQIVQFIRENCK